MQSVQDNLSDLDQQIKNTSSSVVQLSDALIKDIERIDLQSAFVAEKLAALNSFESEQEKSAQQAESKTRREGRLFFGAAKNLTRPMGHSQCMKNNRSPKMCYFSCTEGGTRAS